MLGRAHVAIVQDLQSGVAASRSRAGGTRRSRRARSTRPPSPYWAHASECRRMPSSLRPELGQPRATQSSRMVRDHASASAVERDVLPERRLAGCCTAAVHQRDPSAEVRDRGLARRQPDDADQQRGDRQQGPPTGTGLDTRRHRFSLLDQVGAGWRFDVERRCGSGEDAPNGDGLPHGTSVAGRWRVHRRSIIVSPGPAATSGGRAGTSAIRRWVAADSAAQLGTPSVGWPTATWPRCVVDVGDPAAPGGGGAPILRCCCRPRGAPSGGSHCTARAPRSCPWHGSTR